MKKILSVILIYTLSLQYVFAAGVPQKFPTDTVQMGKSGSLSDKKLIFDVGDGATNPNISVDQTNKDFDLSKTLNVTGALNATGNLGVNGNAVIDGTTQSKGNVTIGSGTTGDKSITVNRGGSNPFLKWSESALSWIFSNDGTLEKKLGTGGGNGGSSGVNTLSNDSFEDLVASAFPNWTNSGGTLTQGTYTNGVENDTKYFQFVATGAGQYFEQSVTVPTNFAGGGCQVDFKKLNVSTANLFKVDALDGSNNVLATGNVGVLSWAKFPTLSFACPAAGATMKIRVTSLAAGTLQGDKAYLGSNQNLVYSSQAKLIGTLKYAGTNLCEWTLTAPTSAFTNYPIDNDCSTPTVSGNLKVPTTKIPAFVLPAGSPAGVYKIMVNGMFYNSGSAYNLFRMSDGTNATNAGVNYGTITGSNLIYGEFSYGSSLSVDTTIQIQAKTNTGDSFVTATTSTDGLSFSVYYFPSSSEVAVSPEQSSWLIDANIGGSNTSLGTSSISSYTEITDTALDMIINTSKGSANAEIPCVSGTSSVGLTCNTPAVAESYGVAFIPPYAGLFEACFDLSHEASKNGNASYIYSTFQVVETPNNSSTILTEGNTRITSGTFTDGITGGGTIAGTYPIKVCGQFNFSDTSKKTLRLMREQASSGSVVSNTILGDRSSTQGQRDIHVTVRPILSAFNRPILTSGQNITSGISGSQNIDTFSVSYAANASLNSDCSSGACYIDQIGDHVSAINFISTGTYNLVVNKTYSKFKCQAVVTSTTNQAFPQSINSCANCNTLTFVSVQRAAGTVGNTFGTLFCQGVR